MFPSAQTNVWRSGRGWCQGYETFAAEVAQQVEVAASEADHLNSWMSTRLGHQISPPDFVAAGVSLMGGHPALGAGGRGALHYEDAQGQRITLYIVPEGASPDTA